MTYTLYDTDGNELYRATGVYEPGSNTAAYTQTTYQLFKNNSVALNGTTISCTATPPSVSLPCAKVNADGVVTQLAYDSAGDLISSATPDGNGSEVATTSYGYDGDGEQTSTTTPDGNLSGGNTGNYTTVTAYNNDGLTTSVTDGGGTGHTVTPVGVAANSLTAASCPTSYPAGYGTRLSADATVTTYNALGQKTQETTPAPAGSPGTRPPAMPTTTQATQRPRPCRLPPTTARTRPPSAPTPPPARSLARPLGTAPPPQRRSPTATTRTGIRPPPSTPTATPASHMPTAQSPGLAACSTSYPWTVTASPQAGYQTTYAYDPAREMVSTTAPATASEPR